MQSIYIQTYLKVIPMKTKTETKLYDLVNKKPVARFFYKGSHTHPVRRTVLVIQEDETKLVGYEFRCGNTVRTRSEALGSIKTYRKSSIAKWGDYSRLRMSSKTFLKDPDKSTLERASIVTMFSDGP